MYPLFIGNKNYSSWSLRPWVLMRELGIDFEERIEPFRADSTWEAFRKFSPTGKVPCLQDGDIVVWDSLAIVEYLAERHECVWPADGATRAWARCAAAEMHSGFGALRSRCGMNCAIRVRLHETPRELEQDIARIGEIWNEGLARFGGPFLAGRHFSAVDAFYCPVAFRIQTYGLKLDETAMGYARRLLDIGSMREWYDAALVEPWRDEPHDAEVRQAGTVLADLRK